MKQMKQNLAQKRTKQKSKIWTCEFCDYSTSHKASFARHKTTRKHQKNAGETKMKQNAQKGTRPSFQCEMCDQIFKSRTTLWRHKKKCFLREHNEKKNLKKKWEKKCDFGEKTPQNGKIILGQNNDKIENKSDYEILISKLEKKDKQHEELWKAFHSQQELLKKTIEQNSEIIPRIGNNNNNKISINLVLNEKCKDAMNLEDFLEKLQVSLEDLQYTKENGYVKGLSNIMVKHLKDLPPQDRPIHCSDLNRLQFYVKDENTWEKDDKNNKMNKSINEIQRKQVLKIKDWTDRHPNYCEDDSLYLEYQQLVKSTMSIDYNDNKDIQHHISDIVNIDDVVSE
tara:strand:- start:33 stop:1052 length:1020 start_codon:yes stop_codon:yes gene_type:complete